MRLLPLALLGACAAPEAIELTRDDLPTLLGVDETAVTGLSTEPETGALVLAETHGRLWRLDGEPTILSPMGAHWELGFGGEVTDVAAMGSGTYALTIPEIGLKVDTEAGTMEDWFCYLPDSFGDWEIQTQQTNSLTFDLQTGHLVSQPQTLEDGEPIRTDVAEFSAMEGGDVAWYPMDDEDFLAAGIATEGERVYLLGDGVLWETRYGSGKRDRVATLPVESAESLAFVDGNLVVVDREAQELVTLALP